jgi:ribosomal protein S18 acetylase RimI-like enzyme
MNYRIIPVAELNEPQITELGRLHHRVMHSLLTDLGLPVVERYYQIACRDAGVIGVAALTEKGEVLGWAVGSSQPDQLNGRLREALMWFIIQMARALITRPRLLWQLVASVRAASALISAGAVELTYIGVDASVRKQGVGRELLTAFLQTARTAGFRSVLLSVEAENESAIALYTKAGFQTVDKFIEGSFHRHRMELKF